MRSFKVGYLLQIHGQTIILLARPITLVPQRGLLKARYSHNGNCLAHSCGSMDYVSIFPIRSPLLLIVPKPISWLWKDYHFVRVITATHSLLGILMYSAAQASSKISETFVGLD